MPKLTKEQMERGRKIFLAGNLSIKSKIDSLTEADAEAMCTTLEKLREVETMKELEKLARTVGKDSHEYFLSCVAETAEELAQMLECRTKAINASIGL